MAPIVGNGTGALFFDERADARQRQSLLAIASGQAGGMPFEIIVTTLAKVLDPQFVPVNINVNGKQSSFTLGSGAAGAFEPVKNPVTGEPEGIRVEHETGFLFKGADVVAAKECRASVGELNFSWPNKAGFVTRVKYGN